MGHPCERKGTSMYVVSSTPDYSSPDIGEEGLDGLAG